METEERGVCAWYEHGVCACGAAVVLRQIYISLVCVYIIGLRVHYKSAVPRTHMGARAPRSLCVWTGGSLALAHVADLRIFTVVTRKGYTSPY